MKMFKFNAELAGVPVEIHCRHAENEVFLQDYRTNKAPMFSIEPTDDDLAKMQQIFDCLADAGKRPRQTFSASFLENNAIHDLIAKGLEDYNVLLVHGSAICMDGEVYMFTAPSGTGKSTHARLWREVFGKRCWMLNDDKPLLHIDGKKVTAYGSPWNGKHRLSRNACAPLKAVACLTQGLENRIMPFPKADAFPLILKQINISHPETIQKAIALGSQLLQAVPFYQLRCNMDKEAAWVAYKGMNKLNISLT